VGRLNLRTSTWQLRSCDEVIRVFVAACTHAFISPVIHNKQNRQIK